MYRLLLLLLCVPACVCQTKVYVEQGGEVVLNCTKSGDALFWVTREGRVIFNKGAIQSDTSKYSAIKQRGLNSYNLKISNAQPADDKIYDCYDFVSEDVNGKDSFLLITIIKPTALTIYGDEEGLDEGVMGQLICNVTSAKPQPKLAWRKKGMRDYLSRSNTEDNNLIKAADSTYSTSLALSIHVTSSLIGSVYVCEVTLEGIVWELSQDHAISVNSLPSTPILHLNPGRRTAGSQYTAECVTTGGRPEPNVTWYLGPDSDTTRIQLRSSQTSQINIDKTYNTTSVLHYTARREHNSWRLTCAVVNKPLVAVGWEARKAHVQLDIQYQPVVESNNGTTEIGDSSELILQCRVDANPPATIKWYHNNLRVNISAQGYLYGNSSRPDLVIQAIKHSDEGVWMCEATNHLGTVKGNKSTVDVKHAPVFSMGPSSPIVGVVEGGDVTLTCKVKADPVRLSHLHWYSDATGKIERNTSTYFLGVGNETLTFTNVDRGTAEGYYCSAKNSLGTSISPTLELQVQYAPERIVVKSSAKNYTQGAVMSNITCSANGVPAVVYSWTKDGMPYGSNSSLLHFADFAKADYKGTYVCKATNHLGSVTMDISIDVLYKPQCVEGQKDKYGVSIGKSVQVKCYIRANPRRNTRVVFSFNGKQQRLNGIADSTDSTVYYASVTHTASTNADYGTYSCNASNTLGWIQKPCVIQVVPSSKPEVPRDCRVDNVTDTSFDVTCVEGFDGGSAVKYSLQFSADGSYHTVEVSETARMHLNSQNPGTFYVMRVCATNEEFPSKESCSAGFNTTTAGGVGSVKEWKPSKQTSTGSIHAASTVVLAGHALALAVLYNLY